MIHIFRIDISSVMVTYLKIFENDSFFIKIVQ